LTFDGIPHDSFQQEAIYLALDEAFLRSGRDGFLFNAVISESGEYDHSQVRHFFLQHPDSLQAARVWQFEVEQHAADVAGHTARLGEGARSGQRKWLSSIQQQLFDE
jgi:hypothetical protein